MTRSIDELVNGHNGVRDKLDFLVRKEPCKSWEKLVSELRKIADDIEKYHKEKNR